MKAGGVCRWAAVMFIGALAAGLASCGGGGSSSSSGGGGQMTITPTAPNSVSVRITDSCDDRADMEWRIFTYAASPANGRPAGVLPTQGRVYVTTGLGVQSSAVDVSCGAQRSVCYGGRRRGDTSGRYWGAGVDGDQSCTNCCVACSTSAGRSLNRRLTCASDGEPTQPVVVESPDLDVRSFSVSDTTPTPGQRITLRATVYNYAYGGGRSSPTTLRYYRSTDSSITRSDTAVGSDSVNSLSPGSSSVESTAVTAPSSGTWYYGACVDQVAGELDPSDDCTSSGEAVRVVVDAPSRPPTPPAVGGGQIRFTLTDQCRDSGALNARFFGYVGTSTAGRAPFVWPSSSRVYTTGNRRTVGDSIDVTLGDSGRGIGVICFGAELEGDSSTYWGVGLDGNQGCSDCCIRVPASGTVRESRNLVCQ